MGVRISNSKIMEISMGLEISMGVLISPQTGGGWVIEVPEQPQAGLSDNLGCTLATDVFFFKSLLSPVWIIHLQSNLKHVGLWHSFG